LIDNIVVNLEKFKEKNIRFISQSRNKLESSQDVNEHNFLNQSIQHPSKLVRFSPLMKSVSDLISDVSVSNALREITGFERFIRWQDMLFDKSTGTLDHADHWY
jgi:phytanoyl-CoA hydroxylase